MHKSSNTRRIWLVVSLILAACLLPPRPAQAFHLPLWEAGAGVGTLRVPAYRGSEIEESIALPFPYIIYRGDILRIDREDGIRGKLFKSDRVNFDLSLAGSIPVRDTDEGARSDMQGLDPLVEAGAELMVNLWRSANRRHRIQFVTPLRFVYSVGDPLLKYRGWTLSPYLNYQVRHSGAAALMRYNLSLGPIYADENFHDYFYEVKPRYATSERPAYDAERGYSGSRVTLSAFRNSKRYLIGAFMRYDNLDRAVFDDSPLVETSDYFAFGFVFGWIFGSSDRTVGHDDGEPHSHALEQGP